jgi:hypothetical protein
MLRCLGAACDWTLGPYIKAQYAVLALRNATITHKMSFECPSGGGGEEAPVSEPHSEAKQPTNVTNTSIPNRAGNVKHGYFPPY